MYKRQALNLAAEALGIDSERYLFKQLPDQLKPMIERSVCNRRRRSLAFKIEKFRQAMKGLLIVILNRPGSYIKLLVEKLKYCSQAGVIRMKQCLPW